MKKVIVSLLVIMALITSCAETIVKDEYTISGKLPNTENDGNPVFLQEVGSTWKERVNIDTAIIENGVFEFKGVAEKGIEVRFVTVSNPNSNIEESVLVAVEPGKIEVTLDTVSTVKGTAINEQYQTFLGNLNKAENENNDDEYFKTVVDFTKANIQNKLGEFVLMSKSYAFDVDQLNGLLASVSPEFKSDAKGQKVVDRYDALVSTSLDKQFTDLKGKTPEGKDIALSDYAGKGKYVLVDFWASWCPPCREDMPLLVEAYKKYKGKGFEIVGVSLDDDVAKWTGGIKKLNITWPQMSDLKGWNSELSKAYGVASIPHTVLIGKDGKIIARGIKGKDLMGKLGEVIK